MAAAGCSARRQFAAACGVLSRCVRAEATAANAKAAAAQAASPTMLLMPGADVAPTEDPEAAPPPSSQPQAQLTIMYAGRVLVLEDFPADRVAELVRFAAGTPDAADVPVARKASLQRFMDKRRDRLAARAPYAARPAAAPKERDEGGGEDARCWLGLGVQGG